MADKQAVRVLSCERVGRWFAAAAACAALAGCSSLQQAPEPVRAAVITETQVQPSAPPTREAGAGGERLNILAGELESFGVRLTVLETRIGELGIELRDAVERDRTVMERSLRDLTFQVERLRTKMDETDDSLRKFNVAILQVNTMVDTFVQHLVAAQKDISSLQAYQKELKASLEKEIAEGKAAAVSQAESLVTQREKIFVEEMARQAAASAKAQEQIRAEIERLRTELQVRSAETEKTLAAYTDRKVAPLLAEVVRHESRIAGVEQKTAAAVKQNEAALAASVDRLYRDIEVQLQQKFKVVLDELVRQEQSVSALAKEMADLRRDVEGRPKGDDLAEMLAREEEDLRKEYQRQLEKRLAFYARLKELLQEVSAAETRISLLEAKLASGTGAETEVAGARYVFYVVKKGDTLWDIARRYGTTTTVLRRLNGLAPAEMLYAGQTLKVPARSP